MALTTDQEKKLDTLADELLASLTRALQGPPDPESIRISLAALAFVAATIIGKVRDPEFYAFFDQCMVGYVNRYLERDDGGPAPTIN